MSAEYAITLVDIEVRLKEQQNLVCVIQKVSFNEFFEIDFICFRIKISLFRSLQKRHSDARIDFSDWYTQSIKLSTTFLSRFFCDECLFYVDT